MINANEFIELMEDSEKDRVIRFGTIDASYTSGRPKILFDGTNSPSVKTFPYASSYTPAPNDRVMVIKNVVVCKIV